MTSFRPLVVAGLAMLAPIASALAQRTEPDIPYGQDPKQRLDLSVPAGDRFPTVVFVHGGSLVRGDKADDEYRRVCPPLVAAGVACANVNYRLGPAAAWPAQAEDAAAAFAWVRANIASRGGDVQRLFLVGHSSGATIVALLGSDDRYLKAHGLATSVIAGVVPMGSIMRNVDLDQAIQRRGRDEVAQAFIKDPDNRVWPSLDAYLDYWPLRHVHPGLPPYLFLIADAEQEAPPVLQTNREFVEQARANGGRADFRVLPDRTHDGVIETFGAPGDQALASILDFIRGER